jgi:hypothetical protein
MSSTIKSDLLARRLEAFATIELPVPVRRQGCIKLAIFAPAKMIQEKGASSPQPSPPFSMEERERNRELDALPVRRLLNFSDSIFLTIAVLALAVFLNSSPAVRAAESWQEAISKMPIAANVNVLNRFNFATTVLTAFQSNDVVKALVLMPGCTDEFYFFRRGETRLTNAAPSLLDVVIALTNQTAVRATFRAPFLLLHSADDPLEPGITIHDPGMVEKLRHRRFVPHLLYNDRDWDFVQPILYRMLTSNLLTLPHFFPVTHSMASWHFYRHSLAGWNLDGWETLQALSLADKTTFTVYKTRIVFVGDTRVGNQPDGSGKILSDHPK